MHRVRLWSDLRGPGGLYLGSACSAPGAPPGCAPAAPGRSGPGQAPGWGGGRGGENKAGGVLAELEGLAAWKLCSQAARFTSAYLSPVPGRPPPLPDSSAPWSAPLSLTPVFCPLVSSHLFDSSCPLSLVSSPLPDSSCLLAPARLLSLTPRHPASAICPCPPCVPTHPSDPMSLSLSCLQPSVILTALEALFVKSKTKHSISSRPGSTSQRCRFTGCGRGGGRVRARLQSP